MPAHAQTSTTAVVAAARRLLEERGADALTMRAVAEAVGVRAPSLYKHVRHRSDLIRLVLDDVTDELLTAQHAGTGSGDPGTDLRAVVTAYRRFAHANPVTFALLCAPVPGTGEPQRSQRLAAPLLDRVSALVGPADGLPAARTLVAWANGFITMELSGGFRLGGDVEQAWEFGLTRILAALVSIVDA